MTAHRPNFDGNDVFDALRQQPDAPDFTRRVMGRLGYMRAVDSALRQRRRTRWMWRGSVLAAMTLAALTGWRVYQSSEAVRRPAELTVPGAIIHDTQQQRMQIRDLIQSIREQNVQPVQPPATLPVQSAEEELEHWPGDDVNRSAVAPGQWV